MRWKLVDSIDELEIGKSINGTKPFHKKCFQDHFPNFPVVRCLDHGVLGTNRRKVNWLYCRKQRGDWHFSYFVHDAQC